jgi:hypothetical protein
MSAALVHFESVSGVDMTGPSLLEPVVLSDDCGVAPVSLMAAGVSAAAGMVSSSATAAVDNHADIGKTSIEASIRFMARLLCVMDRRCANPECLLLIAGRRGMRLTPMCNQHAKRAFEHNQALTHLASLGHSALLVHGSSPRTRSLHQTLQRASSRLTSSAPRDHYSPPCF